MIDYLKPARCTLVIIRRQWLSNWDLRSWFLHRRARRMRQKFYWFSVTGVDE